MHDPDRYETFKSIAAKDTSEFVPELIQKMKWKPNELILDYGCGAGSVCSKYFVPMAQKYNSTIDAIDISEDMLNYAISQNSHPLVQYYQGNILQVDFPLKNKAYDRIFSIYVLHFIKDYKATLKGFYNIMKQGGELGFTVVTNGMMFKTLDFFGKSAKWSPYTKGYENFLTHWYETGEDGEESLTKTLLEIGFTISDIHTKIKKSESDTTTLIRKHELCVFEKGNAVAQA